MAPLHAFPPLAFIAFGATVLLPGALPDHLSIAMHSVVLKGALIAMVCAKENAFAMFKPPSKLP